MRLRSRSSVNSHAVTALTNNSVSSANIFSATDRFRRGSPGGSQIIICVSRSRRTELALEPLVQIVVDPEVGDRQLLLGEFPTMKAEIFAPLPPDLPAPGGKPLRARHKIGNRHAGLLKHDLFAAESGFDQLREARLGLADLDVNGQGLAD